MTRWLVILVIAASLPLFAGNQKTNDQKDVSSAKKSKKGTTKIPKEILKNWDRAFYSKDLVNIIKYASQALKFTGKKTINWEKRLPSSISAGLIIN